MYTIKCTQCYKYIGLFNVNINYIISIVLPLAPTISYMYIISIGLPLALATASYIVALALTKSCCNKCNGTNQMYSS